MLRLGVVSAFLMATMSLVPVVRCEDSDKKSAIVVGATGATGLQVVKELLARPDMWNSVTAISRREFEYMEGNKKPSSPLSSVLKTIVVEDFETLQELPKADAMFNCLGTTRGAAGSAEQFIKVEVAYSEHAYKLAKKAEVSHVSVVTAQGANKDLSVWSTLIHPMLYIRSMGQKQQAAIDNGFKSTTIFQPGLLNRGGDRVWENIVNSLGLGLKVKTLARAMVNDAEISLQQIQTQTQAQAQAEGEGGDNDKKACKATPVAFTSGNVKIEAVAKRK